MEEIEEATEQNTEEKEGKDFKKPVLLIGPRKGLHKFTKIRAKTQEEPVLEPAPEPKPVSVWKTPSEILLEQQSPLPYKEPAWGRIPDREYKLEVLKSGAIVETHYLKDKSYFVFGRSTASDFVMAHPSISRFHAILQYGSQSDSPPGFYVYDLSSTHGTFINRHNKLESNIYVRIQVGHMLRLGLSTRFFILQGPPDDEEPESEFTVTELMEMRKKEKMAMELAKKEEEERLKKQEEEGISWGMAEDADEETDLTVNPFAAAPNEDLYMDDAKKTLRGWYEREGFDLQYDVQEKGYGHFSCRLQLPVDDANGRPLVAEVSVKGKKKEAVIQCALEACRLLDRQGLLRQSTHESRKRKSKNWEADDFYDSDEDVYLDRTGTVERKRELRMKQAGVASEPVVHTYPNLVKEHTRLIDEIAQIENEIKETESKKLAAKNVEKKVSQNDDDDLDAYMSTLTDNKPTLNMPNVAKLKSDLAKLRLEEARVRNLANIARPAGTAPLQAPALTILSTEKLTKPVLPMVGKRPKPLDKTKLILVNTLPSNSSATSKVTDTVDDNEEEFDSD